MRIGYLFRGFLGDVKMDSAGNEVSSPDGNATYSWTIEHECERRGHRLIPLGENLDAPAAERLGEALFASHSQQRRVRSFERMLKRGWTKLSDKQFPEVDAVLLEWRWPIAGRNTPADKGTIGYQTDLERQQAVIRHYSDLEVPIIVWDLDHKFTELDDEMHSLAGIHIQVIETSAKPRPWAKRVEPPVLTSDLTQFDIDERMPSHHLGYIGSRYERDATIDKWINPIANPNGHRVKFWGKWEPDDEVRSRWPGITFAGRIGVKGFRDAYSRVATVPLLAKDSYYATGFMTPRPAEAVIFGSIPVGLNEHLGISNYVLEVADSPQTLLEIATHVRTMSPIRRRVLREEAAHKLSCMDVRHFVDVLEGLVDGARREPEETVAEEGKDVKERTDPVADA